MESVATEELEIRKRSSGLGKGSEWAQPGLRRQYVRVTEDHGHVSPEVIRHFGS